MTIPAILSKQARSDLARAVRVIAADHPDPASGLNDTVREAARLIGRNPSVGGPQAKPGATKLSLLVDPALSPLAGLHRRHRPTRVLRILHTARDLAPVLADLP